MVRNEKKVEICSFLPHMNIEITEATLQDLPAIHQLIGELAEFEKLLDDFHLPLERFIEDYKKGLFYALVIKVDGIIVGDAVMHNTYSTWEGNCLYLEDIIITEKHRRKGYGNMLFEACVKFAMAKNAKRLRWQVLDWNEGAINFYKKYDPQLDGSWLNCTLNEEMINRIGG